MNNNDLRLEPQIGIEPMTARCANVAGRAACSENNSNHGTNCAQEVPKRGRTAGVSGNEVATGTVSLSVIAAHTADPAPEWVARAMRKIRRDQNGCWIWMGSLNSKGYGQLGIPRDGGKMVSTSVHRLFAQLYHGAIPDGGFVCHHCDVRACCNPQHLYIGDVRSNARDTVSRGRARNPLAELNAVKTHCPSGHAYTEGNTYIAQKNGKPFRQCVACKKESARRFYERKNTALLTLALHAAGGR